MSFYSINFISIAEFLQHLVNVNFYRELQKVMSDVHYESRVDELPPQINQEIRGNG